MLIYQRGSIQYSNVFYSSWGSNKHFTAPSGPRREENRREGCVGSHHLGIFWGKRRKHPGARSQRKWGSYMLTYGYPLVN